MNTAQGWPVGVCSWSLRQDLAGVVESVRQLGLAHVHLAVGPALEAGGEAYLAAARGAPWTVTSAMIGFPQEDYSTLDTIRRTGGVVPDAYWPANRALFLRAVDAAVALGTKCISMHAGFLDHGDRAAAATFRGRIQELADATAARGLTLLLETGQESAADLRRFMEEINHPALGINFDPANMILYDKGNPIEAVRTLAPWVRHVHIKDAVRTRVPGQWGAEVPWGDGEVNAGAFLSALAGIGFRGALAIEREAGDRRFQDVQTAVARLR